MQKIVHYIRVLHTSDYHLGSVLHEKSREDKYDSFFKAFIFVQNHKRPLMPNPAILGLRYNSGFQLNRRSFLLA